MIAECKELLKDCDTLNEMIETMGAFYDLDAPLSSFDKLKAQAGMATIIKKLDPPELEYEDDGEEEEEEEEVIA